MKKCGRCPKPAVFHITELRQGDVQALHLCEQCAKEYLQQPEPVEEAADFTPTLEAEEVAAEGDEASADNHTCPNCGITFKEFRATGRLGCAHDYTVFHDELLSLLDSIHSATAHTGKIPRRSPQGSQTQSHLIRLRNQLRVAIEEERYEEAAKLRDQIQQIEREGPTALPT